MVLGKLGCIVIWITFIPCPCAYICCLCCIADLIVCLYFLFFKQEQRHPKPIALKHKNVNPYTIAIIASYSSDNYVGG
jgi:hypothetical protein